jgi:hypothetical protein
MALSPYQQVLDIARAQSAALQRGQLEAAVGLLDRREELLADASVPTPEEAPVVAEIMRLDRDLSSAIRERMIEIRNEALEGQRGRRALDGYSRRAQRRPLAVDRIS